MSSLPVHSFPPSSGGGLAQLPLPPQPPLPTNSNVTPAISPAVTDDGDDGSSDNGLPPEPKSANRWFFTNEMLEDTPSRRSGMDREKEAELRMQAATYIQDIGTKLQVNQLCINTAMVYMHRFYMYHSFTLFPNNAISVAAIFLAAKVEEQPRKLEYVIKVAHYALFRDTPNPPPLCPKSEAFALQASELVSNENIMLQTLGFDVSVDHPHTHVVKCCQLVRASKDLAQTSYFMATNSLHLTTMCLKYQPSVVACVCIHLSCKWSNWEIPRSKEGKEWYYYVDSSVTSEKLDELTVEFLTTFNQTPARLKKKVMTLSAATSGGAGGSGGALTNFPTHFYLDKNSSGGHTIKPRSRSPSPGSSKSRPPPGPGLKQQPIAASNKVPRPNSGPIPPGGPHHHPSNKPNPGQYPAGMDKRPHGIPPKPQFPHLQQGHSAAHPPSGYPPKDGMLPMKPNNPPYQMQHPMANGTHGSAYGNRQPHQHPSSQHHSSSASMGHNHPTSAPGQHSHPMSKPLPGSQPQPNHHFPAKPGQHQPAPPNHAYRGHNMPPSSKPQGPTPSLVGTQPPQSNSGQQYKNNAYVRPGNQTSQSGYPSSNGAHGQYPPAYGARPLHPHAPTHPAHPSVVGGLSTLPQQTPMPAPKPLMSTQLPPPESLKRRQPDPSVSAPGERPMPNMPQLKRPRQEGINPRQEGINPRQEGINPRQEGINPRQEGINPRQEAINSRPEGVNSRQEGINPRQEGANLRQDGVNLRQDGVNLRQDGVNLRQDGVNLRQEGVNPSNLSSLAPSAEEALKQEPVIAAQTQQKRPMFFNSFKSEVRLEAPEVPQAAPAPATAPAPVMPTHSYNNFPLLSSEASGAPATISRAEPHATVIPPAKPAMHAFPQLTNSINASAGKMPTGVPNSLAVGASVTVVTSPSEHSSSSSKKKKKKKDHKHKKEDKEHKRSKDGEKKHKKDKHRDKDKDGEKHKSSKDKHRQQTSLEVEHHGKESKIRIKAMPPKESKDSAKHSKKQAQLALGTVYY